MCIFVEKFTNIIKINNYDSLVYKYKYEIFKNMIRSPFIY